MAGLFNHVPNLNVAIDMTAEINPTQRFEEGPSPTRPRKILAMAEMNQITLSALRMVPNIRAINIANPFNGGIGRS